MLTVVVTLKNAQVMKTRQKKMSFMIVFNNQH
jgi:hypothetical protein